MDDFIQRNLQLFDADEPDQGHIDRFRNKLDAMKTVGRTGTKILLLRIAAVLLLGVVISYAAFREFGLIDKQMNKMSLGFPNPELYEAEQYYTSQLSIYYNNIQKLRFNDDQAEKAQVLQELSAMDEQVQALKYDLKQNPDDERIVYAIIHFYQVKIAMMDVIIARAQQVNNTIL